MPDGRHVVDSRTDNDGVTKAIQEIIITNTEIFYFETGKKSREATENNFEEKCSLANMGILLKQTDKSILQ